MTETTAVVRDPQARTDEIVRLLAKALRLLGDAGAADPAARIAAQAWKALRADGHPAAERFNGVLHYLTRWPDGHRGTHTEGDSMTGTDRTLDVRQELPARRHELIFQTYRDLVAGEGFVLVNDHDPKPLYYQFDAEHTNEFTWDYLEQGPQTWRVRIGRPA